MRLSGGWLTINIIGFRDGAPDIVLLPKNNIRLYWKNYPTSKGHKKNNFKCLVLSFIYENPLFPRQNEIFFQIKVKKVFFLDLLENGNKYQKRYKIIASGSFSKTQSFYKDGQWQEVNLAILYCLSFDRGVDGLRTLVRRTHLGYSL